MPNDYYTNSGSPATGSSLSSATVRAEFASVEAGFERLPDLTGNANKLVVVDAGANALTATDAPDINGGTIDDAAVNLNDGSLVLPQTTAPDQTVEGSVVWDTDNDLLTVGTGSARKTMADTDSVQILTNKTLTSPTISGATISSPTVVGAVLSDGYTEEVYAVSGTAPALSPANGSIQTWALSGNSTPTAGTWAEGQSITLMIDDGTAYTVTWTSLSVTWKTDGGSAPTLNTSGYTAIALWKVGAVIYGARVGDA